MGRIDILPFVNHDPNQPDTLHSALSFVEECSRKYDFGPVPVTFDQPLYIKAAEIVASSSDITNVFVRLGGFHFFMSFLGSIGHIMSESGLKTLWETVYASKSVNHMLTGHAYARALRAHMLSAAAISGHLIETSGGLTEDHKSKLASLHDTLLNNKSPEEEQENALNQISYILDDVQMNESLSSRTGKLWTEYLKMVRLLLLFIRAERTGDWDLHLYCTARMIPVLHAGGHTAYAKSARLYLDQMKGLQTKMSHAK